MAGELKEMIYGTRKEEVQKLGLDIAQLLLQAHYKDSVDEVLGYAREIVVGKFSYCPPNTPGKNVSPKEPLSTGGFTALSPDFVAASRIPGREDVVAVSAFERHGYRYWQTVLLEDPPKLPADFIESKSPQKGDGSNT